MASFDEAEQQALDVLDELAGKEPHREDEIIYTFEEVGPSIRLTKAVTR